jgi:hypothetical protein
MLPHVPGSADGSLADESEAQHMDHQLPPVHTVPSVATLRIFRNTETGVGCQLGVNLHNIDCCNVASVVLSDLQNDEEKGQSCDICLRHLCRSGGASRRDQRARSTAILPRRASVAMLFR